MRKITKYTHFEDNGFMGEGRYKYTVSKEEFYGNGFEL